VEEYAASLVAASQSRTFAPSTSDLDTVFVRFRGFGYILHTHQTTHNDGHLQQHEFGRIPIFSSIEGTRT
jgi:hypothetical protein